MLSFSDIPLVLNLHVGIAAPESPDGAWTLGLLLLQVVQGRPKAPGAGISLVQGQAAGGKDVGTKGGGQVYVHELVIICCSRSLRVPDLDLDQEGGLLRPFLLTESVEVSVTIVTEVDIHTGRQVHLQVLLLYVLR